MREKRGKELWNQHQRLGGETEGTWLVWKEGLPCSLFPSYT